MKLFFKTILLLLFFNGAVLAQENEYVVAIDTAVSGQNKWVPTGVRIGADILSPILTSLDDQRSTYEFMADIDFNNIFLVAEVGFSKFQESGENSAYSSDGTYFRIGPDANFISKDKSLNSFALGLRYARSSFTETLSGSYLDLDWGIIDKDLKQGPITSSWVEIASTLKVRIWKQFFTGYTLRFKFAQIASERESFKTYYVPGYGISERSNNWSFHYYLFYRFAWKKKPIVWKP